MTIGNHENEFEAIENLDEEHWQPKTVERVTSIKYNGTRTEAALHLGKYTNIIPTLIIANIGKEVVSGEERHEYGERLPYADVQGTTE